MPNRPRKITRDMDADAARVAEIRRNKATAAVDRRPLPLPPEFLINRAMRPDRATATPDGQVARRQFLPVGWARDAAVGDWLAAEQVPGSGVITIARLMRVGFTEEGAFFIVGGNRSPNTITPPTYEEVYALEIEAAGICRTGVRWSTAVNAVWNRRLSHAWYRFTRFYAPANVDPVVPPEWIASPLGVPFNPNPRRVPLLRPTEIPRGSVAGPEEYPGSDFDPNDCSGDSLG